MSRFSMIDMIRMSEFTRENPGLKGIRLFKAYIEKYPELTAEQKMLNLCDAMNWNDLKAKIEIQRLKKSWNNKSNLVGDRLAVIAYTEYEKGKFVYGIQFWTQEMIDQGVSINTDRTESIFIEQLNS